MHKFLKKIKLEFFYWRKSIFEYHNFFTYIYHKYFLAKKILKTNETFGVHFNHNNLSIHLLTCHKDLMMTLWSLASFYKYTQINALTYIHNDGSLTINDQILLKKIFPKIKIIDQPKIIDDYLQKINNYPKIQEFRKKHQDIVFLKKLLDPFLVSDAEYKLILDTDVLWFNKPEQILSPLKSSTKQSLMMRSKNGIGNQVKLTNNQKVGGKFNGGIEFYHTQNYSLDKLNYYLSNFNTSSAREKYYIEQAGHTYILNNLDFLNPEQYVISGKLKEDTVAKHYTGPKRFLFYAEGLAKIKKDFLN